MARKGRISALLLCLVGLSMGLVHHRQAESMVDYINNLPGNTWKATTENNRPILPGALSGGKILPSVNHHIHDDELPEHFDAREKWPECPSIGEIRDQASCGSCWAIAAAEAMSDRICIASQGQQKVYISTEDILACCKDCGHGCFGGHGSSAWMFYSEEGVVSGGPYHSKTGCRSYSFEPCEHHMNGTRIPCSKASYTPTCVRKCQQGYGLNYYEDKHFGGWPYSINGEKQIMKEVMTHGPIEVRYDVYEDFHYFKSGIYQHVAGNKISGHAIKLIGWGVEDGVKYWLLANSWNSDWGENGYFRMIRGVNNCDIEHSGVASIPKRSLSLRF